MAITTYMHAHQMYTSGTQTVSVNGELCDSARVYVDPSGFVMFNGQRWEGRGELVP